MPGGNRKTEQGEARLARGSFLKMRLHCAGPKERVGEIRARYSSEHQAIEMWRCLNTKRPRSAGLRKIHRAARAARAATGQN